MRFHWQNLNDSKTHPKRGGGARHGRAWLTLFHSREPRMGEEEKRIKYRPGWSINWEWAFFWRGHGAIGVCFERGDGVGIQFAFAIPFVFSFYLTMLGGPFTWLAHKLLPSRTRDGHADYSDRDISLRFFDGGAWWNVWTDPASWSSKTPKWRNGSFKPIDFIFGRTKYEARALVGPMKVMVPMPERAYEATLEIQEAIWRRPRWPFVWHRRLSAEFDSKQDPIPHPGKGENYWDCGEDATYALSTPCPTGRIEDAIGSYVATVMNSRRRHGGSVMWAPREDHRPKEATP